MQETQDFVLNQTMLRIKDPQVSAFYWDVRYVLIDKFDFPEMSFSFYTSRDIPSEAIPEDPAERAKWLFEQPALLEFTHNYGTENMPS
ncbi:MAG: hypothetical protein ACNYPE_17205 [Candidatus Azotimanducaceae bacterium WSBS_2022_MAG_OTU7]